MDEGNGTQYRLASLERRVDRLESFEPAVVKSQVDDLKRSIEHLSVELHETAKTFSDSVDAIRKILIGFLVSFAFAGISTVIAIWAISGGKP